MKNNSYGGMQSSGLNNDYYCPFCLKEFSTMENYGKLYKHITQKGTVLIFNIEARRKRQIIGEIND